MQFPAYLDRANFGCFHLIMLTRALYGSPEEDEDDEEVWDAYVALNTLRNKLAHNLEPDDLSNLLKRIGVSENNLSLTDPEAVAELAMLIPGLVDGITRFSLPPKEIE